MRRLWAVLGLLTASGLLFIVAGVLRSAGWPGLIRGLVVVPTALLWGSALAAAIESLLLRERALTPGWLALVGIGAITLAELLAFGPF